MTKQITIGVTGAAGFIGSHLVESLVNDGYRVIGIDNLVKGNEDNLKNIKNNPNFQFRNINLTNYKELEKVLINVKIIYHLASAKIPRYGGRLETLLENTHAMENILEIAKINKAKVVFTSTSDVYGKNSKIPFSEESDLVLGSTEVARWAYATTKIFDEQLCFAYQEQCSLEFVIVRLFGVYGPRQHQNWWGGPQGLFIKNVANGLPVEIHGTGFQTRSFVYIDDVTRALENILTSKKSNGQIINIGSTEEISIICLAKMIAKLMEKPLKIKKIPYKSFTGKKYEDVTRRKPSIKKAKTLLEWTPQVKLKEGLIKTIDWQVNNK